MALGGHVAGVGIRSGVVGGVNEAVEPPHPPAAVKPESGIELLGLKPKGSEEVDLSGILWAIKPTLPMSEKNKKNERGDLVKGKGLREREREHTLQQWAPCSRRT